MPDYDFKSLSDKEFESLVTDLLSAEFDVRFERFKAGRDGGIDARVFVANGQIIVQCKHWARTSVDQLIRSLRKEEIIKVQKLAPARYILVTSLELSTENKKNIYKIFAPYMKTEADVLGFEDLNDLLGRNPNIEKQHYKLWLHSATILEAITNAPIIGRSKAFLEEILESSIRYVETANHKKAKAKLEADGVVLITGEPGIGKTTLAKQLCLGYVGEKYTLRVINGALSEAEASFTPEEKVIFYMDDFLGRNYLEALEKQEDAAITSFIHRVSKDKTKRFILTSRSTVLSQAKRISDLYNIQKINRNEFEIRIESLTLWDKARILYNHFWHSDLSIQHLEQITANRNYAKIISHKNFNPRLIEFILDAQRVEGMEISKYWDHISNSLKNPEAIWDHVYEYQLNDYTRAILLLVAFNGKELGESDLRQAYRRHLGLKSGEVGSGVSDFIRNITVAVGCVVDRLVPKSAEATYNLFNPSIGDYLVARLNQEGETLLKVFSSLETRASLGNIRSLIRSKTLDGNTLNIITKGLVKQKLTSFDTNANYRWQLSNIAINQVPWHRPSMNELKRFIAGMTSELINEECDDVGVVSKVLTYCLDHEFCNDKFVQEICFEDFDFDEDGYRAFGSLLNSIKSNDVREELEARIKPMLMDFLADSFNEYVWATGRVDNFYSEDEEHEVSSLLEDIADERLMSFGFFYDQEDIEELMRHTRADEIIENNIRSSSRGVGSYLSSPHASDDWAPIDDLFQSDLPDQ